MNFLRKLLEKYWTESLIENILAGIIVAIILYAIGWIYLFIRRKSEFTFSGAFGYIRLVAQKFPQLKRLKSRHRNKKIGLPEKTPVLTKHSTVFFRSRLGDAFPGQRGLKRYKPKAAVERFQILFREPLRFQSVGHDVMGDPVWWFRGKDALPIHTFKVLSNTKILLGQMELEIKSAAVWIDDAYYKSFVYLEAKDEPQTGAYQYEEGDIQNHISRFGYFSELYGLLGKKNITRQEYDDGAAVIKGKIVDAEKAEPRERFLSDYNFIIAAKQSPFNSNKFVYESEKYFNDILLKERNPKEFFDFLRTFNKNER